MGARCRRLVRGHSGLGQPPPACRVPNATGGAPLTTQEKRSMMPRPDPVPSDPALPKRVSVVVIGGGIAGTSTALALAQKGVSVALCEKGEIGAEQSGRNWGWVRIGNRDPREVPLMIESKRIWLAMNETVEGETGYR